MFQNGKFLLSIAFLFFLFGLVACQGVGTAVSSTSNGSVVDNDSEDSDLEGETDLPKNLVEKPEMVVAHYPLAAALTSPGNLKVYGKDFLADVQVFIGGVECLNPLIEAVDPAQAEDEIFAAGASEKITCEIPEGVDFGDNDVVVVQVDDTFAKSPSVFTYEDEVIGAAADLEKLRRNWGRSYTLANDIDMAGVAFDSLPYFFGSLDGQGNTLSNLQINAAEVGVSGFIGVISGAVTNLTFDTVEFNHSYAANVAGVQHASGIVAGLVTSTGVVSQILVTNSTVNYTDPNESFFSGGVTLTQPGASVTDVVVENGVTWTVNTTADHNVCISGMSQGDAPDINYTGATVYLNGIHGPGAISGNADFNGCALTPMAVSR